MSSQAILTPIGIASFINLKEPRAAVPGGELRFKLNIIFDKVAQNSKFFKALEEGIDEAIKTRWPHKPPPGLRSPFREAGEKEGQYEGYKKGDIFISPWSKMKPGVVDINRQDIIDFSEIYAGWTCRANVRPFVYENTGNRGCNFTLDSVQFLRPGKRLDGRKAAAESFPDDQEMEDERV
jgi:hypothetical protein